jgi:putative exosortase-associated protein (TIGR04073 family)
MDARMASRPHRLIGIVLGMWLCLGLPPVTAAADDEPPRVVCPICRNAASNQAADYPTKATHTLVRGAANTLFGWTEVIRQPAEEVKAGGNLLTGIVKGIGQGMGRTVAGAGEVLTFWTPKGKGGYLHFATDCPVCVQKR